MANTKFDQNHFVKKIYQIFPIDQIIKHSQFFLNPYNQIY